MVVLLTVVVITMSLFNKVTTSVSAQYQEINQGLPALAPLQTLLRAEVEPGPTSVSGRPVPGFGDFSQPSTATINNYSLTFYSNIGTAYNNVTSAGTTAGPAKIIAAVYTSSGVQETNTSSCTTSSPCTFQVRVLPWSTPVFRPVQGSAREPRASTRPTTPWSPMPKMSLTARRSSRTASSTPAWTSPTRRRPPRCRTTASTCIPTACTTPISTTTPSTEPGALGNQHRLGGQLVPCRPLHKPVLSHARRVVSRRQYPERGDRSRHRSERGLCDICNLQLSTRSTTRPSSIAIPRARARRPTPTSTRRRWGD